MNTSYKDVMGYFSEELRILDRNTVQLMIDEMQDRIDRQSEQLGEKDKQLDEQKALFDKQLSDKDAEIERLKKLLAASHPAE